MKNKGKTPNDVFFVVSSIPNYTKNSKNLQNYVKKLSQRIFLKTTYIGVNNQEIFIPRFSYFIDESGMTVASFKSLKSKRQLEEEIENYIKDFEYFNDFEDGQTDKDIVTFGYRKGDLYIQSYTVVDEMFYRRIYITY